MDIEALRLVLKRANSFLAGLRDFVPALIRGEGNQAELRIELGSRGKSLRAAISSVTSPTRGSPTPDERRIGDIADTFEHAVALLFARGLASEGSLVPVIAANQMPAFPENSYDRVCEAIQELTEVIQEQQEIIEAEDALKRGLFPLWVARQPGKGSLRRWGPIKNQDDQVSQTTWVYQYPQNTWVIEQRTEGGPKGSNKRSARVVAENEALRVLYRSDIELDPETLGAAIQSASLPDKPPPNDDKPVWDSVQRQLFYRGILVRTVNVNAKNVELILNAFQKKGWERRIENPFGGGKKDLGKLSETLRTLREGLDGIDFRADGTGLGVEWIPCEST